MYEIALKDAIGNTTESLETTHQDLGVRTEVVTAKAVEEKKKVESVTTRDRLKEQKVEDAKADIDKGADGRPKRKPPTLYKPGEAPQASDITKQPGQPNQP
jgi:hypothetical protein